MRALSARLHWRLAIIAAFAVLPALGVILYDQSVDRRSALERTLEEDLRLAHLAAVQQGSVFAGAARLLDTLAQLPSVSGDQPDECNALLAGVLHGNPGYLGLIVFNLDGRVFCGSDPSTLSVRSDDRPWFKRAVQTRGVVTGEYQLARASGRPDITVARPVLDRSGRPARVIAAGIELEEFQRLAKTARLGAGGTLTLLDRNRTILARYPNGSSWVGHAAPSASEGLVEGEVSEDVQDIVGIDGVRRLYVTVPLDAGFETGLSVTVGSDRSAMLATIDRLKRQQISILALVALVALGVALVGGRVLVLNPVAALGEVLTRIARGDLRARAQLTPDTFGFSELGDAVNAMAASLEEREADRVALEQQLRLSEGRYRLLFEQNPQPMWVVERGTLRFLEANDAAVRKYGYSWDEFLAMRLSQLWLPGQAERLHRDLDSRGDNPSHRQVQHVLKSGEVVDVEVTSHPITFNGRPARLAIAYDVTSRVRAEQQVIDVQERLRFALAASQVGVWEVNLVEGTTYWSESCEALHGLAPGAYDGTMAGFLVCVHPADRTLAREGVERAIREQQETRLEYRTVWPDGTERWILSIGRFFFDQTGRAIRGAGISQDTTDRRSLEEALRQSQKMEAVGQLAGGIAHDFNNMLTAIVGNAELVLDDLAPDDPRRPGVKDIERAAKRGADLTHQLLAFSRKQILAPRVVHLGDIVGEVTPMLRRLIGETVDLKAVVNEHGRVKADAGQIGQVLVNLAVNARDAMPAGGRLTIETGDVVLDDAFVLRHPTAKPGPHVLLAVTDTGCGMEPAIQRRIFEPFFTTKAAGQGTGLGLATVYGIVQQSGGHISVESAVGRGTTFRVYLPTTGECESFQLASGDTRPARGSETILLVEDEPAVRDLAMQVLKRYGYTVHGAGTPAQAIRTAIAHDQRIDLLVTDVVLPEMNGCDVAQEILQRHPESKVLFMSGYADDPSVQQRIVTKGAAFLQKPFTGTSLGRRVREVLDGV